MNVIKEEYTEVKQRLSLFCLVFLILSACGKTPETLAPIEEPKAQLQQQQPAPEPIPEPQPPTWEEQYDLGLRYLSEGKYEEAIIAFTAAIEIDPKRAPAFIGRGDTYVELARPETNLTSYDSAEKDYQVALELDDQAVEVYVKLSEVYLAIDEPIKAVEILQQGYDVTGDESLKERIETLQKELSGGTFIGIPIDNLETYREQYFAFWRQYRNRYGDSCGVCIRAFGVYFPVPARVIIVDDSGKSVEVEISEAELRKIDPTPMIGKAVELKGYFTFEDRGELTEVTEHDHIEYLYHPNGPYSFYVETMHEIEIDETTEE